jgi:vacuolar-type H+-ATPase subunit E/Vma4
MASGSQRQIKQMVNFITQEAKEKANEIRMDINKIHLFELANKQECNHEN